MAYFHNFSVIPLTIAIERDFPVVRFIMLYKVVQIFEPLDEILKCADRSNQVKVKLSVVSCGNVYYSLQGGSNLLAFERNP